MYVHTLSHSLKWTVSRQHHLKFMETSAHSWIPTMEQMPEQERSYWKRVCFWFSFCFEEVDICLFLTELNPI